MANLDQHNDESACATASASSIQGSQARNGCGELGKEKSDELPLGTNG